MAGLRELPGIGPFYAALVQVRSTGVTDVLPTNEPRVLACAGELYGLDGPMSQAEFEERARGVATVADLGDRADPGRHPPRPDRWLTRRRHPGRGYQVRQKGWPAGSAYTRQLSPCPSSRVAPSASTAGSAASTSSTCRSRWNCCG